MWMGWQVLQFDPITFLLSKPSLLILVMNIFFCLGTGEIVYVTKLKEFGVNAIC